MVPSQAGHPETGWETSFPVVWKDGEQLNNDLQSWVLAVCDSCLGSVTIGAGDPYLEV